MFLGPREESSVAAAMQELDAVTSPRAWVQSHRLNLKASRVAQLELPAASKHKRNPFSLTSPLTGSTSARKELERSATADFALIAGDGNLLPPRGFERPATAVGKTVPTTARWRFVEHCHSAALPPEPLIINKAHDRHTNQLNLPHYGIGNK